MQFSGYTKISNVDDYFKRSSLVRGADLYTAADHVCFVGEEISSAVALRNLQKVRGANEKLGAHSEGSTLLPFFRILAISVTPVL